MDTYSILREIADSWGLLGMVAFFIGAILMLFRPSAKQQHKDASLIPFRENELDQSDLNNTSKPEKPLED